MIPLLQERGLGLLAYGVLAGGFLTDRWLGEPEPDLAALGNRSLVKYKLVIDDFGGWAAFQELLRTLHAIGDRHGVTVSAVTMRWALDQPGVAAVIIGARYARHLPEHLQAFSFVLDEADRSALRAVRERHPGPKGEPFARERDRLGPHGRIMKYNLNAGSERIG
jgi:aryl-alcohol dehydrogenase-like predicted oxidoreductase